MKTSEQIDKLAEALAKAQGLFTNPEKNRTVEVKKEGKFLYCFDYADLAETINATRKGLSEFGICHTCTIDYTENHTWLIARLIHCSGQWIESSFLIPITADIKGMAGAITYGRRYLLNALLGIAADEDTDGAQTQSSTFTDKPPKIIGSHKAIDIATEAMQQFLISEEQWKLLKELGVQANISLSFIKKRIYELDPSTNGDPKKMEKKHYELICAEIRDVLEQK